MRLKIIGFFFLLLSFVAFSTIPIFVSPTPANNTDNLIYPILFNISTDDNSILSASFIEIDSVNKSCILATNKLSCAYTLPYSEHIFNHTYSALGYANLSGTLYPTNETRTVPYYGCGEVTQNSTLIANLTRPWTGQCFDIGAGISNIVLDGNGYTIDEGIDNYGQNNTIKNFNMVGDVYSAIWIYAYHKGGLIIDNNTMNATTIRYKTGIREGADGAPFGQVTITNNRITGAALETGLMACGGRDYNISNNIIFDANQFEGHCADGIYLYTGEAGGEIYVNNNTISNLCVNKSSSYNFVIAVNNGADKVYVDNNLVYHVGGDELFNIADMNANYFEFANNIGYDIHNQLGSDQAALYVYPDRDGVPINVSNFTFGGVGLANKTTLSFFLNSTDGNDFEIYPRNIPATLPNLTQSFNNKSFMMRAYSTSDIYQDFKISYTDAEATGYNESKLQLYTYTGTTWTKQNTTVNPTANTINLGNYSFPTTANYYFVPVENIAAILYNITSNSPASGYSSMFPNAITFNYSTGAYLLNCSLFIDNLYNKSQNTTSGGSFSVSYILVGSHTWFVSCDDGLGNVANSSTKTFSIIPPSSGGVSPSVAPPEVPPIVPPLSVPETTTLADTRSGGASLIGIADKIADASNGAIGELAYTCTPFFKTNFNFIGSEFFDRFNCEIKGLLSLYLKRTLGFVNLTLLILLIVAWMLSKSETKTTQQQRLWNRLAIFGFVVLVLGFDFLFYSLTALVIFAGGKPLT